MGGAVGGAAKYPSDQLATIAEETRRQEERAQEMERLEHNAKTGTSNQPPILPRDTQHEVAPLRIQELSQHANDVALFYWLRDNHVQFLLPDNVPQPSHEEQHKRLEAHQFLHNLGLTAWIQIYTQWSNYTAKYPKTIDHSRIADIELANEKEQQTIDAFINEAYEHLKAASRNIDDFETYIAQFKTHFYNKLAHVRDHDKSFQPIPLFTADNASLTVDATKLKSPNKYTTFHERTFMTAHNVARNSEDSINDVVTQMENLSVHKPRLEPKNRVVLPLDSKKSYPPEPRTSTSVKKPRDIEKRTRATDDADRHWLLPLPLHVSASSDAKPKERRARSNTPSTDDDRKRRKKKKKRTPSPRDRTGKDGRRHRKLKREPSPSPSPSPSDSSSSEDTSDDDHHRRRRRHRRRRSRTRSSSRYRQFAHGSQISTLKTFDGVDRSQALNWLRDIETAGRKYNWSDTVLVDAAVGKLTKHAYIWYNNELNITTHFTSWATFSRELLRHFYPKGMAASAASQLTALKYDNGRPEQLYNEISKLAFFTHEDLFRDSVQSRSQSKRAAATRAHENTTRTNFKAKMPPELHALMMTMQDKSSKDLLEFALQWEAERQTKAAQPKNFSTNAVARSSQNKRDVTCHYCGYKGHVQPDCRHKQRDTAEGTPNKNRDKANRQNQQQPQQQQTYSNTQRGRGSSQGYRGRGQQNRGRGRGYYGNRNTNAVAYDDGQHQQQAIAYEEHQQQEPQENQHVSYPPSETHQENY